MGCRPMVGYRRVVLRTASILYLRQKNVSKAKNLHFWEAVLDCNTNL